ncbi:ribosomal protein S18-alanine N-acetyltransferase [Psychrobacter sp. S4(2024)]|uniref:ribosomal protein S18-alanine N-acetyltransferase n=1 Tax=Psychrobacter sp. S4(2024) TaxID=3111913 RepID=UPI002FE095FC
MLDIKMLLDEPDKRKEMVEAVAAVEAMVQLQDPWTSQTIADLLEQDSISLMVVTDNSANELVGYCLYQLLFEQAEILRIGTHPDYQRQGIASRVFIRLDEALKANQVESLLLEVRADNTAAIALYEQQGFTVIHTRKSYYQAAHQPAVDALIMQRIYN